MRRDVTGLNPEDEAVLEAAFEHGYNAMLITDADFAGGPFIQRCNPAFCAMTGYTEQELIGQSPRILQGPDTDRKVIDQLDRRLRAGEFFEGSTVNYRKDGESYVVQWNISPVRDAAGAIVAYISIQHDITARLAAERERSLLAGALNAATDPVIVMDKDFVIVFANTAFGREVGRPVQDLLGRSAFELRPQTPEGLAEPQIRRVLAEGGPYRGTVSFGLAGGKRLYLDLSISSLNGYHEQGGHYVAIAPNITHMVEQQMAQRAATDGMLDPQVLFEAVRDADGRVVDLVIRSVNRATCLFMREREENLLNRSTVAMLPNLAGSGLIGRIAECLQDGRPVIVEDFEVFTTVLDDFRRYDIRATRAGAELIVFTWRDVTERYQAMQRIADSERNYRLLAENSGDVVTHVREGRFVWVSPSVTNLLGAPSEYWLGRDVQEMIPRADLSASTARMKALAEGEVIRQRIRVRSVEGATHWIDLHARPLYDDDGRQDGYTAALRLIDAEVFAEEELEEARRQQARADQRYRRSMDNAAVGMCLATPDGRFTDVNDALCQFFGYDADTLTQKTFQELTAPEYLEADLENANNVLQGRIDSFRMLKQYIHADGHLIWADLSVSCIRDEAGHVETFIGQIIDVTATVEANDRIRILAQELQQQTDRVTAELESAASYLSSIMPRGLVGKVSVSSRYLPSRELGGDSFDYRWIDDDHLLVYLIDVSGHGLAPALLSVSLHNMLRSGSLGTEILLTPDAMLGELNRRFQMDQQGHHYFTMWYGVYEASTRTLSYASAGAPPASAFTSATGQPVAVTQLSTKSAPVGMFEDTVFVSHTYEVPPGCRILIYSDGASEITRGDDRQLSSADFTNVTSRVAEAANWSLDDLVAELRALTSTGAFEDDCSLIQLTFD